MSSGAPRRQADERQPPRPGRCHDGRRATLDDDDADRLGRDGDPADDAGRPIAVFDQQEFTGRPVDGQQVAAVGQRGEVGQAAADVVLGDDLARGAVSTTERLPLRALAASSVLPPSTTASATGWRSRRAGGSAVPGSPARARPGESAGARARPTAPIAGRVDGVLMASPGPSWRIAAAAVRTGSIAPGRPLRPACGPVVSQSIRIASPCRDPRGFVGECRMIGLDAASWPLAVPTSRRARPRRDRPGDGRRRVRGSRSPS